MSAKHSRVEDLIVVDNRRINDYYFVLKLKSPAGLPPLKAGEFVNILAEGSSTTFLRRPISIYDVNHKENTLDLLIQIVGDGTAALSRLHKGETANLVYPLGKGFSLLNGGKKALLAGGGVGIAPLLFLGKELKNRGVEVHFLLGGRGKDNIIEVEKFSAVGNLHISTEDGSVGEKGLLTQNSIIEKAGTFDMIYTCGPDPMMKAVARIAKDNDVSCEVSLENLMACGIGACLCCVEETTTGNRCVCTDGPVFNINELKWT